MSLKIRIPKILFKFKFNDSGQISVINMSGKAEVDLIFSFRDLKSIAPEKFVRKLAEVVCYYNDENKPPIELTPISKEDVEKFDNDVLEEFSENFIKSNDWLLNSFIITEKAEKILDEEGNQLITESEPTIKSKDETYIQFLHRVFHDYLDVQLRRTKKITDSFRPSLFSKKIEPELEKSIFENLIVSGSIHHDYDKPFEEYVLSDPVKEQDDGFLIDSVDNNLNEISRLVNKAVEDVSAISKLFSGLNNSVLLMIGEMSKFARSTQKISLLLLIVAVISMGVTLGFSVSNYFSNKEDRKQLYLSIKSIDSILSTISKTSKDQLINNEARSQFLKGIDVEVDSLISINKQNLKLEREMYNSQLEIQRNQNAISNAIDSLITLNNIKSIITKTPAETSIDQIE